MDDLFRPIVFSEISDYQHMISKKDLQKLPCFQGDNVVDARRMFVSHCFYKWCNNASYEDVKMKLFILSFDDDDLDWLTKLKDKQVKTYNELIDAFMEKWKEKKPPDIKSISPYTKIDTSPDSIEKIKEIIQAMQFAHEK